MCRLMRSDPGGTPEWEALRGVPGVAAHGADVGRLRARRGRGQPARAVGAGAGRGRGAARGARHAGGRRQRAAAQQHGGPATPGLAWDVAMDLAVLELEAPFGGGARSRPILMATQPSECAARASCHVVRALGLAPRLRIVDAVLVPGEACAERARGWPGLRDSALCLVGPTLCGSDWGAGVVCEGKLCGVLSRSVRSATTAAGTVSEPTEPGEANDQTCGDTHVAQSVARWRRFLHCAHTLRACGRGGECAQLCSERRLLEGGGAGGGADGGAAGGADEADTRRALSADAAPALAATSPLSEITADTESPSNRRSSPPLTRIESCKH
ncbi:unnamed protein product [Chrysodeixis includens]|uniref:Uncharacterized protein n=1 Tax=Chrysodeixis includens TaxID=689277 RepID=A0A9N8Q1I9_CHRIL|nr:unnamed protein product [Chrysodeixis includens]